MMNRSEVYSILSEAGLLTYQVLVNNKPYKKLYIPHGWAWSVLKVNGSFIRDFNHVYICTDEIVIRDKLAMMQINIPYKFIESLEVYGDEE